jgi:ubiquitin-protein ligase
MDLTRIRLEFSEAQRTFAYVELHPTSDGKVYSKTALQTGNQMYVLSIRFPDSYPNEMPRVYVDAPS